MKAPAHFEPLIATLSKTVSRLAAILVPFALLFPAAAMAHTGHSHPGGFASGLHHPLSGWDHILAMLAVGLWSAQLGGRAMWLLPLAFPVVMALGGLMGLSGIPLPGVELGIALSAVILGALVLFAARAHVAVAAVVVAAFAVFHGYAHGAELPAGASAFSYGVGFLLATAALHLLGIGIGMLKLAPAGAAIVRTAGLFVLAGGCYFVWRTLGA